MLCYIIWWQYVTVCHVVVGSPAKRPVTVLRSLASAQASELEDAGPGFLQARALKLQSQGPGKSVGRSFRMSCSENLKKIRKTGWIVVSLRLWISGCRQNPQNNYTQHWLSQAARKPQKSMPEIGPASAAPAERSCGCRSWPWITWRRQRASGGDNFERKTKKYQ